MQHVLTVDVELHLAIWTVFFGEEFAAKEPLTPQVVHVQEKEAQPFNSHIDLAAFIVRRGVLGLLTLRLPAAQAVEDALKDLQVFSLDELRVLVV